MLNEKAVVLMLARIASALPPERKEAVLRHFVPGELCDQVFDHLRFVEGVRALADKAQQLLAEAMEMRAAERISFLRSACGQDQQLYKRVCNELVDRLFSEADRLPAESREEFLRTESAGDPILTRAIAEIFELQAEAASISRSTPPVPPGVPTLDEVVTERGRAAFQAMVATILQSLGLSLEEALQRVPTLESPTEVANLLLIEFLAASGRNNN